MLDKIYRRIIGKFRPVCINAMRKEISQTDSRIRRCKRPRKLHRRDHIRFADQVSTTVLIWLLRPLIFKLSCILKRQQASFGLYPMPHHRITGSCLLCHQRRWPQAPTCAYKRLSSSKPTNLNKICFSCSAICILPSCMYQRVSSRCACHLSWFSGFNRSKIAHALSFNRSLSLNFSSVNGGTFRTNPPCMGLGSKVGMVT